MRVTQEKSAGALFTLYTQVGSNTPRGTLTADLRQVQAISRPDTNTALVGLLVSGIWIYGLLVEEPFKIPDAATFSEQTIQEIRFDWLKRVDHVYDELGAAWAASITPAYKVEYTSGLEFKGK